MNEISIRIFWGPWGGEFNPSPIVSVGNLVGFIVPMAPALVKEDKSWMIKTDERKAVYACHSKERCFNSDNYMQLLVCVIIPKGKRLAGEKSPLDLLDEVRSQFDQRFTIDLGATLPLKADVDAAFNQLLAGYVVEDCPWFVFNMEGDKPASFCVKDRAQLNALMRYNAYPALAHVELLELGFKCKTTVNINTRGQSGSGNKKGTKIKWWWGKDKEKETKEESRKEPKKGKLVKEEKVQEEKSEKIGRKERKTIGQAFGDISLLLLTIVLLPFYWIYKLVKKIVIKPWPSLLILGLLAGLGVGTIFIVKSTRESKAFKSCETAYDYKAFLEKYPNSKYREAASFFSCNAIDQYRHYLNEYPQGAFSHLADSIVEEYVRDSTARREKAEQEAYERCMVKDTINAYNACMDYLAQFEKRYSEIESLKNSMQMSYYAKDNVAYRNCMASKHIKDRGEKGGRLDRCKSYLLVFKYGKYLDEVEEEKEKLEADCEKGRDCLLVSLNRGERHAFVNNEEGYLDAEEFRVARWFVYGCNIHDDVFGMDIHIKDLYYLNPEHYIDNVVKREIQNEVERTIFRYRAGDYFIFSSWQEVKSVYQDVIKHAECRVHEYVQSVSRENLLEYVNNRDLIGFRASYDKNRRLYSKMDVLVVEWILDYERCLKQEGLNMSDDALLASMAIRDYLEKDLGFPKTPFKSWNEAANAKKKIDDIVIKYKSGTP